MSATKYNFELNQGETFDTVFTIMTADRRPFDLSEYSIAGQIRKDYRDVGQVADFIISADDGVNGKVRVQLTADSTSLLDFGRAYYDLEATHNTTGVVIRLIQGVITLSREATK